MVRTFAETPSRWWKRASEREWLVAAIAVVAALALRALGASWRIRSAGLHQLGPDARPILGAFWHRNLIVAAYLFRDRGFSVPISRSRDGNLIAAILARLGYAAAPRGSSSRGGAAALRGLVRLVNAGTTISIQPDGPRGPARRSKPGIVALARLTDSPIVPIAIAADRTIRFRTWDATILPIPFSRITCALDDPIDVQRGVDEAGEEAIRERLDECLNALTNRCDDELGYVDPHRVPDRG